MPVNDWIEAGRAGAQGLSDAHGVIRDNSPKYGETYRTNMNARANERIAQLRAREKILSAKTEANIVGEKSKRAAKAIDKAADKKVSGFRKAGILGALGGAAGGALTGYMTKQEEKRLDERDAKREAADLARLERYRALLQPISSGTPTAPPELIPIPPMPTGSRSSSLDLSGVTIPQGATLVRPGDAPPAITPLNGGELPPPPPIETSTAIPTSGGLTTGQPQALLPQSEYYAAVIRAGGTPDEARVLSAIVGPESKFYADNDTVKSGLVSDAGEVSVGPWQINMTPGPLRTERMQKYGITDLSQLYDPNTSARIALDLARTPTGYNHWSAYRDGLHTPYLGGHL